MITAISIESLAVARGDRALISGFNLTLDAGEAVALAGRNGAGKTSLLRAVAGLIRPSAGRVVFHGEDGEIAAEDAVARDAHLIGHQDGLKLSRTAWDEALFQAEWTGGTTASARAACARLGLGKLLGLQVRKLSAGQRRRLALARLAASPRSLWLLDEPMAPLDRDQRGVFGQLMAEHLAGGGLILAAAHDPLPIAARPIEVGGGENAG
ncbi:MAG TPA: heme ABC exporter ATP-binding protein CcmA [Caulobacteraceae bacterium]|nr:heme ABC exporter ATP-binding protein CcmA [Caulobacteraceae bacterium]